MFAAERAAAVAAVAAVAGRPGQPPPPPPALGPGGAQRARVSHCPACGQGSFQANGNNLVRCWSCAQHYCAACHSVLRGRVGQHYIGAGSCKRVAACLPLGAIR